MAKLTTPQKLAVLDYLVVMVSGDAFRVAWLLMSRYDLEGGTFPSQATLCAELQISERTLRTMIRELEAVGFLKVKRRGWSKSNAYTMTVPDRQKTPDQENIPDRQKSTVQKKPSDRQKSPGQKASQRAPERSFLAGPERSFLAGPDRQKTPPYFQDKESQDNESQDRGEESPH